MSKYFRNAPGVVGFLIAAAIIVCSSFFSAGCFSGKSADAAEGGESAEWTASIDDECGSSPTVLVIPAGKKASGFKLKLLEEGVGCHEEGPPDNKGYAIRDSKNTPIYMWSQFEDRDPYEKGGPLSSLVLKPGEYTLSVAGGAGARVSLTYSME